MLRKQSLARMQWLTVVAVVLAAGALAQAQDESAAHTAPAGADALPARRPQPDMTLLVDEDHDTTTSDRWIGLGVHTDQRRPAPRPAEAACGAGHAGPSGCP